MDPSIIKSLIGNLGLSPEFSWDTNSEDSPNSNNRQRQINKNKKGVQVVININGRPSERRGIDDQSLTSSFNAGFHAVFLDNNQVYFGRMQRISSQRFVTLREVYYLRDVNDATVLNFDLIKLGSEIHSPEDEMHINVDKVVFWEKLQDDGPIVTAILNFKKDT